MIAADDLQDVFDDHAECCLLQGKDEPEPRFALAVVQAASSGSLNGRNHMRPFIDTANLPRGADWGYGLIWAEDAPPGMNTEIKMTVTDSTEQEWSCESARAVYDLDGESRQKVLVAWRLVLRGKQRMTRR